MANNWLIVDNGGSGRPLNLDFVTDVQWGGDFPTPTADQQKTVFVYQAVPSNANAGTAMRPNYAAFKYASAVEAVAAFNRIIQAIKALGYLGEDLRVPLAAITSVSPGTVTAGVDTVVTVNGSGFSAPGTVTINGIELAITLVNGNQFTFHTGTAIGAGGPYEVIFTTPTGKAARKDGALLFT